VFRVPRIEGGARVVVHYSGKDLVVFLTEEVMTEDEAQELQAALNQGAG
jgi:hypothetical protein